ncbi:MAG: hypothetical protein F9K46_11400 [Anaerolineae bacterium]|nr:MAG: hypothetical protein F9K46_11400 [Anaerolineae bacterium]
MTENRVEALLVKIGRLYDDENVTAYEAQTPDETLRLLILQSRGHVRIYKSKEVAGLPYALSAELTEAGLQRARELRQKEDG